MPTSQIFPEIMLAFVTAIQVEAIAFFVPAGLGVTQSADVVLLTEELSLGQAMQVAFLARVWQTMTGFYLASIGFLFRTWL